MDNSQVGADDLFYYLVGAHPAAFRLAADEFEGVGLQLDCVRARCHERESTRGPRQEIMITNMPDDPIDPDFR